MDHPLLDGRAVARAGSALANVRGALGHVDVDPYAERDAVVTPIATPGPRDLIRKTVTRHLAAVISTSIARPRFPPILRHLRRLLCALRQAGLAHLEGGSCRLRENTPIRGHIFANLLPLGRQARLSALGDTLIFFPGNLRSVPSPPLRLADTPGIQSVIPRKPWIAARA